MTAITIDENIIEGLKISSLPIEKQKEIINRLENIILTKLSAKVINELSLEDKKTYIEILGSNKQENIHKFLSDKIYDFDDLVEEISVETVNKFKK